MHMYYVIIIILTRRDFFQVVCTGMVLETFIFLLSKTGKKIELWKYHIPLFWNFIQAGSTDLSSVRLCRMFNNLKRWHLLSLDLASLVYQTLFWFLHWFQDTEQIRTIGTMMYHHPTRCLRLLVLLQGGKFSIWTAKPISICTTSTVCIINRS